MSDDMTEVQDSETTAADKTVENEDVQLSEEELLTMDEETSKRVQTLAFQKSKFRDQLKAERERAKELEAQLASLQPPEPPKAAKPKVETDRVQELERELTSVKLRQINTDLEDEDIKKVMAYADISGVTPQEALKDPVIEAMLEKKSAAKKAADATPDPSSRGGVVQTGSRWERVLNDPTQLASLSEKERVELDRWRRENNV